MSKKITPTNNQNQELGGTPASVQIHQMTYQGPIPAPSIMDAYAKVDPSFPERIMRDFEKNSEHIRKSAELELQASVEERKRGQWMAFWLSALLLGIVGFSLWLGNTTFAGISGVAFIGLLIRSFIASKGQSKK